MAAWKYKGMPLLVSALFIVGHLTLFPYLYLSAVNPIPDDMECGMPALAITLLFWVMGMGGAMVIFTISWLIGVVHPKNENS